MRRLSLFRWRLEWLALLAAAVGLVIGEQAREARERDPYLIHAQGRSAAATILAVRDTVVDLGVRRGEQRQETRTYLDLQWFDHRGERRRVESYRLPPDTAAALGLSPPGQRPAQYVNIHFLDWPADIANPAGTATAATPMPPPHDATSPTFQAQCQPRPHCRLVVLLPSARTPSEANAAFVDLAIVWAPRALWWGLAALAALLALRFVGVIDNRPSLE